MAAGLEALKRPLCNTLEEENPSRRENPSKIPQRNSDGSLEKRLAQEKQGCISAASSMQKKRRRNHGISAATQPSLRRRETKHICYNKQ